MRSADFGHFPPSIKPDPPPAPPRLRYPIQEVVIRRDDRPIEFIGSVDSDRNVRWVHYRKPQQERPDRGLLLYGALWLACAALPWLMSWALSHPGVRKLFGI